MAKLQLTDEVVATLQKQRDLFIVKFGREPTDDDPVFFDEHADTPTPIDGKSVENSVLAGLIQAGIPAHIVYAYRKTGLIVNEAGYKNLSFSERRGYNAAIDEYFGRESLAASKPVA